MSAETAVSQGRDEHYIRVLRRNFRTWRGQRPFWAGLLTLLGGIPIAYFPYATFKIGHMNLAMQTTAGSGSLIIGVLLVTLGLTMWFQHIIRVFAGVATILLALVSLPIANLGGFIVGFVLSLTGGALSLSWAPGKPVSADEEPAVLRAAPGSPAVPEQRHGFGAGRHETSIEGNGGRNSAG